MHVKSLESHLRYNPVDKNAWLFIARFTPIKNKAEEIKKEKEKGVEGDTS